MKDCVFLLKPDIVSTTARIYHQATGNVLKQETEIIQSQRTGRSAMKDKLPDLAWLLHLWTYKDMVSYPKAERYQPAKILEEMGEGLFRPQPLLRCYWHWYLLGQLKTTVLECVVDFTYSSESLYTIFLWESLAEHRGFRGLVFFFLERICNWEEIGLEEFRAS